MGKHKDSTSEDENIVDGTESPQKRHKRHKHKKHKKRKQMEESEGSQDLEDGDTSKTSLVRFGGKLKIKFGKEANDKSSGHMSDKNKDKINGKNLEKTTQVVSSSPKSASKRKRGKGKDSGTSSEEERWLDAIESGKLEEVDDELKKIKPKDPKLMTARQRAMFERKTDKEPSPGGEQLMALPSGYKEKVMTAEALQKAALKSQKRKQLADEKREKDKKKTMDRLLKKQASKSGKSSKIRSIRKHVPRATYRNGMNSISISLPSGIDFPLQSQKGIENDSQNMPLGLQGSPTVCNDVHGTSVQYVVNGSPNSVYGSPTTQAAYGSPVSHHALYRSPNEQCHLSGTETQCGASGCFNRKKYACSNTGVPLCSFDCYLQIKTMLRNAY